MPDLHENPFSLVYDGLMRLARDDAGLSELIAAKNFIDLVDLRELRYPLKDRVQDADFPELTLVDQAIGGQMIRNSSSSMVQKTYAWIIVTGQERLFERFYPVEWHLFRAMIGWRTVLTELEWDGQGFVKKVDFADSTAALAEALNARGVRGWSCLWQINVEMWFPTNSLHED